MTSNQTSKLTSIFRDAKDLDDARENLGDQILAFLIEKNCRTLPQANEQFRISYDENGWSRTAGRPKDGSTEVPAPPTVKNYVTTFRRAYKHGLKVLTFKTMGELRKALSKKQADQRQKKAQPPALRGVQVTKDDKMIGALVHDLYVVMKRLPEEFQAEYEDKLQRLLGQMIKKAHIDLPMAA